MTALHVAGSANARISVSFNRPNITFAVRPKVGGQKGLAAFAAFVARTYAGQSGIVYCREFPALCSSPLRLLTLTPPIVLSTVSRDECSTVCDALCAADVSACVYHAGMTPRQRVAVQRDWCTGATRVACATIAFGMGIDRADVRFVLHYTMPKSIENCYQEAGRAGRDGQPASHTLFFAHGDHSRVVRLIRRGKRQAGGGNTAAALRLADAMRDYCTQKSVCRRVQLLDYLGEQFDSARCRGTCDNCARAAGTLPPGHDDPLPGAGTIAKPRARKPKAAKGARGKKRARVAKPRAKS